MKSANKCQNSARPLQTVVCIHSSGNSSKQWRRLVECLKHQFDVMAVDLHGAGSSPAWTGGRLHLEDEIALLEPVLQNIEEPFHLVGHSYGAAVASRIAVLAPDRVRSLCLFEPVLFGLLNDSSAKAEARADFAKLQKNVRSPMWERRPQVAAQFFIDYWSDSGTWDAMPGWAKGAMVAKMPKILQELDTPRWDNFDLADYHDLHIPTLLLWGSRTPPATQEITRLLMRHLPNVRGAELADVGHMGPVTHPEIVNPMIQSFLTKTAQLQVQYLPQAA